MVYCNYWEGQVIYLMDGCVLEIEEYDENSKKCKKALLYGLDDEVVKEYKNIDSKKLDEICYEHDELLIGDKV